MMIFKTQVKKFQYQTYSIKTLFFITSLMFGASSANAKDQALDSIAAIVNSDVIMVSELRAAAQQVQSRQSNKIPQNKLFKDVLEQLVMDKIQVQKAKSIGIKIDDAAVDTAMLTIAEQNKLNLQQLRLAIIERGLNYKVFREGIRDRLYSDNLRQRQQGRNNIADNEVDDLIRAESFNLSKDIEYQLVDILIPNTTSSVAQFNTNIRRAHIIRNKLLSKSDLSKAEITKLGGTQHNLGWQSSETLSPAYSRALSLMGKGELSNVIRDDKGFHILKLIKQRGGKRQQITEARVRHLLISNDDPQAKLKVTQLRNRILAGENFAQLATKFSADKGSARKGGELPMTDTSNYVPAFKEASNTLAFNTLSQPIQTKFGWHIIEVLDRNQSDKTRDAIKNQAKTLIGTKNKDEELKNWLKSLRDEAFVEYRIKL